MLVDRYAPRNLFTLIPELEREFDPQLRALDRLLDDDVLFQAVKADLGRRYPHTTTRGRHSTPVEVILRLLVVKRLFGWSYEQTEYFVADSLVLRQFCRVYLEPVPDDTTLIRWARLIGPETLERLNGRVVDLARSLRVTRGRRLRVDSTVVETAIHHPTDSRTIGDGVRVLGRLLRRTKAALGETAGLGKEAFRSHVRTVRRLTQELHRVARRKGEEAAEALQEAYAKLLHVARQTCRQAERVRETLHERATDQSRRLGERFDHFLPLVGQAMRQAERRVLHGEVVPAKEKLLSLFEPHTQVIQRHKPGKPVEFGRKLLLDEVEGGIISRYHLLDDGGLDHPHLPASLAAHQQRFGRPPDLLAGDRGLYSAENERLAEEEGVKRIVLPKTGRISEERRKQEHARWFRRGFRFRAGIEGRISVLRRRFGLRRCPDHGLDGLARYIGWGILAYNLRTIAAAQAA
ncbi:MAG TPA: ISNCY family transposase [Chloroflexota bacterium]|jgi:IS5 family transposase|nr:ISNCY family transposase [Chloroflexota bacterium]